MGINRQEKQKLDDVLKNVDPETPRPTLEALTVKMMALQTNLLNDIAAELSGIERCLERIAGRM